MLYGLRYLDGIPEDADLRELKRYVEHELPFEDCEIFGDCTQAHLDQNRAWLVPRFQDATSGILILTIQSFLTDLPRSLGPATTSPIVFCPSSRPDRRT